MHNVIILLEFFKCYQELDKFNLKCKYFIIYFLLKMNKTPATNRLKKQINTRYPIIFSNVPDKYFRKFDLYAPQKPF